MKLTIEKRPMEIAYFGRYSIAGVYALPNIVCVRMVGNSEKTITLPITRNICTMKNAKNFFT